MNEERPEHMTALMNRVEARLRAADFLLATPGDLGKALYEELTAYREKAARQSAIEVLLAAPDEIPDPLEAELYAFRDYVNGPPGA